MPRFPQLLSTARWVIRVPSQVAMTTRTTDFSTFQKQLGDLPTTIENKVDR